MPNTKSLIHLTAPVVPIAPAADGLAAGRGPGARAVRCYKGYRAWRCPRL